MLARLLSRMINEGAKILEDGLASRASDIDVIWVYGRPVYRAGPMYWADRIGLKTIRDRLLEFQRRPRDDFSRPTPRLGKLADQAKGFLDK